MLKLDVVLQEGFDESKGERGEFVPMQTVELTFEHSLLSLSKWESKWEIAFLGPVEKTDEQMIDYIRTMITSPFEEEHINHLSVADVKAINDYINKKHSAATLPEKAGGSGPNSRQIVTSDLIYYWMVAMTIPFEPCETWHLNRLITLIRITDLENQPKKKPGAKQTMDDHRAAVEASRARFEKKG